MILRVGIWFAAAVLLAASATDSAAQTCKRNGSAVTCEDGRAGTFAGNAIIWPDGTKSSLAPHPSVIIGNKPSVRVGPGVFVGNPSGKGSVPLDDPNAPNKKQCAVLDGVPYCH
jgi:hypothetical protein